jgi:hypothetical protein
MVLQDRYRTGNDGSLEVMEKYDSMNDLSRSRGEGAADGRMEV